MIKTQALRKPYWHLLDNFTKINKKVLFLNSKKTKFYLL